MSEQQPEDIRRDIARTRADMDQTLAQIEDRVSPDRIKERQVDRVKSRWNRVRESVMGSSQRGSGLGDRTSQMGERASQMGDRASQVGDRASDGAQQLTESARQAPDRVEDATRGNPLAAGLVAFGLGAMAGSMVPASKPERQLADTLRDQFEEPVRGGLQSAGDQMKGDLQEHAQQAVEETKQTAQDAAERTTSEAKSRAESVRGEAEGAAETLQQQRNG